ncbi:hypothetical protein RFI_34997, partial [Reticulomyxa filosa]
HQIKRNKKMGTNDLERIAKSMENKNKEVVQSEQKLFWTGSQQLHTIKTQQGMYFYLFILFLDAKKSLEISRIFFSKKKRGGKKLFDELCTHKWKKQEHGVIHGKNEKVEHKRVQDVSTSVRIKIMKHDEISQLLIGETLQWKFMNRGDANVDRNEALKKKLKRVIIEKFDQHILNADLCYQSKQQNEFVLVQTQQDIDFGFFLEMLDTNINTTSDLLLSSQTI